MQERPSTTASPSGPTTLASTTSTSRGGGADSVTAAARPQNPSGIPGTTKIADSVVSRIVGLATREVPGVYDMTATGFAQAFGGLAGRVTGQEQADRGVVVQVGEIECIADLNIVVDANASIPQVAEAIRRNVRDRITSMTGLQIKEININVADIYIPGQEAPATGAQAAGAQVPTVR